MRFAICQELFEGWEWERQCEFIAKTGYTGVEVAPFTFSKQTDPVSSDQLQSMRTTAAQHGLQIIGLHWLLAQTEGLHLTSEDDDVREDTAQYIARLALMCDELGGDVLVFGSPFQRSIPEKKFKKVGMDCATKVFKRALELMGDRAVRICMEPLTEKETNFINTCAEAVELMQLVDDPRFVLHQDVKAMLGAESEAIPVLIDRYKDVTGHFHVNDSNLLGPGMGETKYEPILKALLDAQYDGWVSVEVFDYSPGCEHIARVSLEYLQQTLDTVRAS
ncbi:MAG: sugar phosphate isomerase/epimerase family protein [Planctomycetaceae bacterium]